MITLDATTKKLQIALAGASSTTGITVVASWFDESNEGEDTKHGCKESVSNGASDVDVVDAPRQNFVRNIECMSFYNADSITSTLTVKIDNATVETIIIKAALATLESLHYDNQSGWYAMTAAGSRK